MVAMERGFQVVGASPPAHVGVMGGISGIEDPTQLLVCLGVPPLAQRRQPTRELDEREREVLRLVSQGYSNKAIGRQLFISERTVAQHLTTIFNKLGANTRAQAVGVAAQRGLF